MKANLFFLAILLSLTACFNNETEQQAASTQIEPKTELKSVFVNGDSLHYLDIGEGEPIVFVHGGIGDYRSWTGQLDTFSTNYRVIAYSRRYAYPNRQDYPDSPDVTGDLHAADLVEQIKKLDIAPVHLVGHSYGALTSFLATLKEPDLVRSLTLGEPPVWPVLAYDPDGNAIRTSVYQKAFEPSAEAFRNGEDERALALFLGGVLNDTIIMSEIPNEVKQGWMDNLMELEWQMLNTNWSAPVDSTDVQGMELPVLLVAGDSSPEFLIAIQQQLDRFLPLQRIRHPREFHPRPASQQSGAIQPGCTGIY